jgi:hypothetical protein
VTATPEIPAAGAPASFSARLSRREAVNLDPSLAMTRPASRPVLCCDDPECTRLEPISIYLADFSNRVFAVTRRRVVHDRGDGTATFAATERHDISSQLREFLRRNPDWVRAALSEGTSPS